MLKYCVSYAYWRLLPPVCFLLYGFCLYEQWGKILPIALVLLPALGIPAFAVWMRWSRTSKTAETILRVNRIVKFWNIEYKMGVNLRSAVSVITCIILSFSVLGGLLHVDNELYVIVTLWISGFWLLWVSLLLLVEFILRFGLASIRHVRAIQKNIPPVGRPKFDRGDFVQRAAFGRQFGCSVHAGIALALADRMLLDFQAQPDDAFLLCAGSGFMQLFLAPINQWTLDGVDLDQTFGDVVEACIRRGLCERRKYSASMHPLWPGPEIPVESPPWPPELCSIVRARRRHPKWKISASRPSRILRNRPQYSSKLFRSYWGDPAEAEAALLIVFYAREYLDRPENLMCYPNDPMFFLIEDVIEDDRGMELVTYVCTLSQDVFHFDESGMKRDEDPDEKDDHFKLLEQCTLRTFVLYCLGKITLDEAMRMPLPEYGK